MWLFAKEGFLSIVENRNNKDQFLVRARIKGDIEKYFPDSKVIEGGGTDYLYRAFIPKSEVLAVVSKMVCDIDYDNYKANISDSRRRHNFYVRVWTVMQSMQDRLMPKP
jgi:hypothetical protein